MSIFTKALGMSLFSLVTYTAAFGADIATQVDLFEAPNQALWSGRNILFTQGDRFDVYACETSGKPLVQVEVVISNWPTYISSNCVSILEITPDMQMIRVKQEAAKRRILSMVGADVRQDGDARVALCASAMIFDIQAPSTARVDKYCNNYYTDGSSRLMNSPQIFLQKIASGTVNQPKIKYDTVIQQ